MLSQMARFHSFYGHVVFHCMYMHTYHIFFNHGHVGCFHISGTTVMLLQWNVFSLVLCSLGAHFCQKALPVLKGRDHVIVAVVQ